MYVTIIRNIIICIGIYKKILFNLCFQAEIQYPGPFFTPGPNITSHRRKNIAVENIRIQRFNLKKRGGTESEC